MPPAGKKKTHEIPEEYEDRPEAWKKAFRHAAEYSPHNSLKACLLYADAHQESWEEPTLDRLTDELDALERRIAEAKRRAASA